MQSMQTIIRPQQPITRPIPSVISYTHGGQIVDFSRPPMQQPPTIRAMSAYTANTLSVHSTPIQPAPQTDPTYPTQQTGYQSGSPDDLDSSSSAPGAGSASAPRHRSRMTQGKGLKAVCYHASVEEMLEALRGEIEANTKEEALTFELCLNGEASINLLRPLIGPYAEGGEQDLPDSIKRTVAADGSLTATVATIANCPQPNIRQLQRAASRGLVAAIESLDGFRYTFNNVWTAKDDDGLRFSWICQDSMQNKDRHANGFARTSSVGKQIRGARKATFDCKGTVNVKFSARSGSCMIQYRHRRVHCKVDERLPGGKAVPIGEYGQDAMVVAEMEEGPPLTERKRKRAETTGEELGFGKLVSVAQKSVKSVAMPLPVLEGRVPSLFELLSETAIEDAKARPMGSAAAPWWGNS